MKDLTPAASKIAERNITNEQMETVLEQFVGSKKTLTLKLGVAKKKDTYVLRLRHRLSFRSKRPATSRGPKHAYHQGLIWSAGRTDEWEEGDAAQPGAAISMHVPDSNILTYIRC